MTSLRQFIREEKASAEAAEEAARIERERPIKDITAKLAATHGKLLRLERERISIGKDASFQIDAAVKQAHMSIADAAAYNAEQAAYFVAAHPNYYPSETNQEALTDYLFRNGVQIASAACYAKAFQRLSELGLLETAPETAPEPEPEPIPIDQQPVRRLYDGWDIKTGEPRQYTEFEIDRMSADELRIAMRLPTVNRIGEPGR